MFYRYLNWLLAKISFYDVSGILYVFGIPGIIGGCLSAIYRARYLDKGALQVAGTFISMAIGLIGGAILGIILRFLNSHTLEDEFYNDQINVNTENMDEYNANPIIFQETHNWIYFGATKRFNTTRVTDFEGKPLINPGSTPNI